MARRWVARVRLGAAFAGSSVSFLMLGASMASAEDVRLDGLAIGASGLYREKVERHEPSARTAMGYLRVVSERELVMRTDTVCARLGVTFGFDYVLLGSPAGALVRLEAVTRFPPQGMTNAEGRHFAKNEYEAVVPVGGAGTRTFTFEEPWRWCPARGCSSTTSTVARSARRPSRSPRRAPCLSQHGDVSI